MQTKVALRKKFLDQRLEFSKAAVSRKSIAIRKKLIIWLESFDQTCFQLLFFSSIKNEPELLPLVSELSKQQRKTEKHNQSQTNSNLLQIEYGFGLPVIQKNREMNFYNWVEDSPYKISQFGVIEPIPTLENLITPGESLTKNECHQSKSCCIAFVPALAVDAYGNRLGYGGSYYDSWLFKHPQVLSIAVVFDCFVVDELSVESHDIPVDFVVTEHRLFKTAKS